MRISTKTDYFAGIYGHEGAIRKPHGFEAYVKKLRGAADESDIGHSVMKNT